MDRLSNWQLFNRVVETGSFSAAARDLGISQPQVSKIVAALEGELRVRLVTRSPRGLRITEEGQRFYEQARQLLKLSAETLHGLRADSTLTGPIRLSIPVGFGNLYVVPLLMQFLRRHPDIELAVDLRDSFVDLVVEGVDLAIRIGSWKTSAYECRNIGHASQVVVAAPEYLEKYGEPQQPVDLEQHNCLLFSDLPGGSEWHFSGPQGEERVRVSGNYRANNAAALAEAVTAGLGIALTPVWMWKQETRPLRTLLTRYTAPLLPVQLLMPTMRYRPLRLSAIRDYLEAEMRKILE